MVKIMEDFALLSIQTQINRIVDQIYYSNSLTEFSPNFPSHIHIEPTNACNLRCIHCIQEAMTRKRTLMSWETYVKIIDEIRDLGIQITLDVQGEPLLHPQILEMINYAKNAKCHVSLLTNATRLTPEISRKIIELRLDRIVFSFDAVQKDIYEKIRRKSKFEPTFKNILNFIKINYESGSPVFICMSAVCQKANLEHLNKYKELCYSLPIDAVFINPLLNMLGSCPLAEELPPNPQLAPDQQPVCRIPWENITVNADGSVCSCPVDFNVVWCIGNINDTQLKEMWNNEKMRTFRRAHLQRDFTEIEENGPLCSKCNCRFDPEYDMRNYKEFAKLNLLRQSQRYAKQIIAQDKGRDEKKEDKYNALLKLLNDLEKAD